MEVLVYILLAVFVAILIVCLTIASYSGSNLLEKFEQVNKHLSSSFTVASDFCCMISQTYLASSVMVGGRKGHLTDAYIPSKKTVFLSESTFSNSSVAALAVAAHELGHALQDYQNPATLRKHKNMGIACKLIGLLMYPMVILGVVLLFTSESIVPSIICIAGAIAIFVFALVVKLMTIKIEKDASKKALSFLKDLNVLEDYELKYAKQILNAALLTYIGDFLQALLGWTMLTRKTKLFGG